MVKHSKLSKKISLGFACSIVVITILLMISSRGRKSITGNTQRTVSAHAHQLSDSSLTPQKLDGVTAVRYLENTSDGRSLAQSVTAARFGLKWQDHSPFGDARGGYQAMSHVQNLNAWFGDEGVTIRPTLSPEKLLKAWQLRMNLRAYGYGEHLSDVPAVVSRKVYDNRIQYDRSDRQPLSENAFGPTSNFSLRDHRPQISEWYENLPAGIEQGFTLDAPPPSGLGTHTEGPLRLLISLQGDLHASSQQSDLQLLDHRGNAVLIYGKLNAKDSRGRMLSARMQTNEEGTEIELLIDDKEAIYPIEIDPVTASLEQKLTKPNTPQTGTEFGDAVAISEDTAIVGSWLEDQGATVDVGRIYIFTRSGSTWTFKFSSSLGSFSNAQCGWSVALNEDGTRAAFGCPGKDSNTGFVELLQTHDSWASAAGVEVKVPFGPRLGDRFGESVALNLDTVVAGSPFADDIVVPNTTNVGRIYVFEYDLNLNAVSSVTHDTVLPNESHLGSSVAISGNHILAGMPGTNFQRGAVRAYLYSDDHRNLTISDLTSSDGASGDMFGYSVSISRTTAVIGAPLNDTSRGTNAGAAYVFELDDSGNWNQRQKLTASDGTDDDHFGQSVAIDGNTILIGSPYFGTKTFTGTRGNGRAYIYMRNTTDWVDQGVISALFDGAAGDKFGISVAFDGTTVISGAEHAAPSGTLDAGAVYIHRLSCVPPNSAIAGVGAFSLPAASICPGTDISIQLMVSNPGAAALTYQWRKNGINLPGATNSTYLIHNSSTSDAGSYDAVVSDSCGGGISKPFTLNVFTFTVFPASQNVGAAGNTGLLAVNATGSCPWTAVSNVSWITVTTGATGMGGGNVGFKVDPNTSSNPRTGTMTVAGQTVTFNQDGAALNVVQFSSSNYSVQEDCTTVTITVNRIGDTSSPASVNYNTADVTASNRKDYILALGRLDFAAGETSKSFAVLINEDSIVEGNETFNVNLSNPTGVGLGAPSIATVTILDDPSEPSTNPIDAPQNFVCQQYHDFLSRQPDDAGLAFWTGNITSCGTDAACIENRRINVSAAFYLSIEFRDTGYLVERIYKTAYGDATGTSTFPGTHSLAVPTVRLNEFLSDTQRIGQGVVVNQGNWQAQLETNKQAFTGEFVTRSRFTTAFPTTMTAAQFVDTLNANAGSPLSATERNQLVNDLSSSAKTRAQVLRQIAEHTNLVSSEFNRAFVLMQFFGYLRRNPNDPQDTDYTGYDFWLTKLNQFSGDFVKAEMVKAFISSIEYRQRFGPN